MNPIIWTTIAIWGIAVIIAGVVISRIDKSE